MQELNSWGVNYFDSFSFSPVRADNGGSCAHNSQRKYLTPDPAFKDNPVRPRMIRFNISEEILHSISAQK